MEYRTEIYFESFSGFLYPNSFLMKDADFFSIHMYTPLDSLRQDSLITWTLVTEQQNICPYDMLIVDFALLLNHADTSITVIGGIQENPSQAQFITIHPNNQEGTNYRITMNYNLIGNYVNSTSVLVTLSIKHKSRGSFDADRDYFFSNLDIGVSRIIYHEPK